VIEHADQPVPFEPTGEQKLRLKVAQLQCHLNIARRCLLEGDIRLYQGLLSIASSTLPVMQAQLADLECEDKQLTQRFFEVGEQVKTENNWPTAVRWDATTLSYSSPEEKGWTAVPQPEGAWKKGNHALCFEMRRYANDRLFGKPFTAENPVKANTADPIAQDSRLRDAIKELLPARKTVM